MIVGESGMEGEQAGSGLVLRFVVPAVPIAQPRQRHRIVSSGGRTFTQNYTPSKSPISDFKATVRMAAREAYDGPPLACGVGINMEAVFVLPRPESLPKSAGPGRIPHAKARPDLDNLMKGLADALSGLLWSGDGQLCSVMLRKVYAAADEQPHVDLVITEVRGVPVAKKRKVRT